MVLNRKGSMVDGLYVTVIVLVLFLGFTTAKIVWDKTTEDQTIWNQSSPEVTKIINRYDNVYMPLLDRLFVFAVIGTYMGVLILAYFIRGSPVFLAIMIIITTIGTVLATFVSNAHNTLMQNALIASTVAGWTMTDALITNLPIISFFYMVVLTIVMLAFGETI